MGRSAPLKRWLLPLLALAGAPIANAVDIEYLRQTVDQVGNDKIYYPWGPTATAGTTVQFTVSSTAPASQPTLVYNCHNMAAICKNVEEYLSRTGGTLPKEFVYDLTGSDELADIKNVFGSFDRIGGKKFPKGKIKQLSHIRRDQSCGTTGPSPEWKAMTCPRPNQPSIIQSRFRQDWDEIGVWTQPKKETRWIKARDTGNVDPATGNKIFEQSGLVYTCDEFPPASWVQGGSGPANARVQVNLFCAPHGNTVVSSCKVFDKFQDTLALKITNALTGEEESQQSEQDWQGRSHGYLAAALRNIYGKPAKYGYFQFTTVPVGNNHGSSSRAWVVSPPSATKVVNKRNGNSTISDPAEQTPSLMVVYDEETPAEKRLRIKREKAAEIRRRAELAISSPTPTFAKVISTAPVSSRSVDEPATTSPPTLPSSTVTSEPVETTNTVKPTAASEINDTPLWQARRIIAIAQKEAGERNNLLVSHPRMNRFPHMDDHNDLLGRRSLDIEDGTGVNKTIAELAALVAEADYGSRKVTLDDIPSDLTAGISRNDSTSANSGEINKRAGPFWMSAMNHNRASMPFNDDKSYKVWRNVKDYGAVGDGQKDDTAAINKAISDGNRCGADCGSSTVKGAVIYFPPGTYLVSSPIIQYYYTQFIGDPTNRPTIKASKSFVGLGMLSSDVYIENGSGNTWYINQNNFYRQIRNFILDIRDMPNELDKAAAIHWQVAQATSLQNIIFLMPNSKDSKHMGIFMENGSGGWLSELVFRGGKYGMFCGNQQFTTRALTFAGTQIAIRMIWDWGWTWKDITITNADVGISLLPLGDAHPQKKKRDDPPPPPGTPNLGSLMVMDSTFNNVKTAVLLNPPAGGLVGRPTMNLFNVQLVGVGNAVAIDGGRTVLAGGSKTIDSYGMGWKVDDKNGQGTYVQGADLGAKPNVHASLLQADGKSGFFTRNKPQYQDQDASAFMNVKDQGAKGDGVSDDTASINNALSTAVAGKKILFFPAGSYIVTDTIKIPPGSRIVGQAWSQILCTGKNFQDPKKPRVMVRVGAQGDSGIMEISDMLFSTKGPTPGAVLMEWNIRESTKGSAAMWDSHFRVGGAKGTDLQAKDCPKLTGKINPKCMSASLLFHMTRWSSAYLENVWVWTADHDLDVKEQTQIDVYTGRGVLLETRGPTWLYGTASEHSVLYQYQILSAQNIFLAGIQTESPYYQTVPKAPSPFEANAGRFRGDPLFSRCKAKNADPKACAVSWGLRIVRSTKIYFFGGGLYSWFQNYEPTQACVKAENCQEKVVHIMRATELWMYNVFTKGVIEMISPWSGRPILASKMKNTYVSSLMAFFRGRGTTSGSGGSGGGSVGSGRDDYGVSYVANPTPGMTVKYPPWFWIVDRPPASCIYPCTAILPPITVSTTIQPPPVTVTIGPKISTITPPPVTNIVFPFETVVVKPDDPDPLVITPKLISTTTPVPETTVTDDGSTYVIGFPILRFPLPTVGPLPDPPPCMFLCDFPPKVFPPITFHNDPPPTEDSPPPGPPPGGIDPPSGGEDDVDPKIKGSDSDDGTKKPKPVDTPEDEDPKDIDHPPKNNPVPIDDGGPPPPPGPPGGPPSGGDGSTGPPPEDPEDDPEDEEEDDECARNDVTIDQPETLPAQPRTGGNDGSSDNTATVNGNPQPAYPKDPKPPPPTTKDLDWNSGVVQCYNSGWSITHAAALRVVDHFCGKAHKDQTLNKDNKLMTDSYIHPSFLTGTRVIMEISLLDDSCSWKVDGPNGDQWCGAIFRRIINGCDRNTADFKQGGTVDTNCARFKIDPDWDAGSSFDLPSIILDGIF